MGTRSGGGVQGRVSRAGAQPDSLCGDGWGGQPWKVLDATQLHAVTWDPPVLGVCAKIKTNPQSSRCRFELEGQRVTAGTGLLVWGQESLAGRDGLPVH